MDGTDLQACSCSSSFCSDQLPEGSSAISVAGDSQVEVTKEKDVTILRIWLEYGYQSELDFGSLVSDVLSTHFPQGLCTGGGRGSLSSDDL